MLEREVTRGKLRDRPGKLRVERIAGRLPTITAILIWLISSPFLERVLVRLAAACKEAPQLHH